MTTIIIKDKDGEMVKRNSMDDGIDTWFSLTELFLEALGGLGYNLSASPTQLREILEDYHDKCMAVKYPKETTHVGPSAGYCVREQPAINKVCNTPEDIRDMKGGLGKLPQDTVASFSFYDAPDTTIYCNRFDGNCVVASDGSKIDLTYVKSWKTI